MTMRFVFSFLFLFFFSFTAQAAETLRVFTWDTYLAPALFKKFTDETGIQVMADIYTSNDEMLAKLKTGAVFDIAVPSGHYIELLAKENLIQPLPADVRSLGKTLDPTVQNPMYDPEYTYALPALYGTTSILVDGGATSKKIESLSAFFERPAGEAPSLGVLDETVTVMNLASLALGKEFCDAAPETWAALEDLLQKQKPFVKVYGSTGYFERLSGHEISFQMVWNGDAYRARQQNPDIRYIYPREGVEVWIDNFVIPKKSKNPEAAKKFIAFMMRPENNAAFGAVAPATPAVAGAKPLLPTSLRDAPEFNIPAGTPSHHARACPPEVLAAYQEILLGLISE